MQPHAAFAPIAALMFATGLGIPVFAAFNAGLGQQLGGASAAIFVMFCVGLVLATVVLFVSGGLPPASRFTFDRPWLYCGVAFMLFYALSITWAAPKIGVGNAVFFVLLGQLVAAASIDHFGWWGAVQASLTPRRALGIAVMAFGVFLARKPL